MPITIEITNTDEVYNGDVVSIRTYKNKGSVVDDGELLGPGESATVVIDSDTFIQADVAVGAAPETSQPDTPKNQGDEGGPANEAALATSNAPSPDETGRVDAMPGDVSDDEDEGEDEDEDDDAPDVTSGYSHYRGE